MSKSPALTMLATLLSACSPFTASAPYLPTYPPMDGGPLAIVEGTLVHDGGCLWIDSGTERWLMLWPRGSSARQEGAALVVHNGGHRAVVGTRVSAVGGEYKESHYDFVVELVGREISQACRATGQYWLGRDVQTIDPARQGRAD